MNLVKGEPRDAGPKLTATSGLALALARSSQLPNYGGVKNATLALSDPSSVEDPKQTRDRSNKIPLSVNLVHIMNQPTGRTFRKQKNPINPTKRLSHESQQGGVWCQLSPRSSAIRIAAGYAGRKGNEREKVEYLCYFLVAVTGRWTGGAPGSRG
jgi:hypothetical protein